MTLGEMALYSVDSKDEVVEFKGLPPHAAGAPMPLVVASDRGLMLAYEIAPSGEELAIVRFNRPSAHYFGPPNDEAISGHPLAARGLQPYGIYEIRNSSWVRLLERMNRSHKNHDPSRLHELRHFVFTFHDETFECLSKGVELVTRIPNDRDARGSLLGFITTNLEP